MSGPDYQSALGFELVTVTEPNGAEVHMIREAGTQDRVATLEERVLWDTLTELVNSLYSVASYSYSPDVDPAHALEYIQVIARAAIAKATGGSL